MTKIKKETTIDAPVAQVYAAWRNFENLPYFMKNIEEVSTTSDTMSHWKAKGPLGMTAEWDAEITLDEPNHAIGWRGIEGASSVINSGRVNFNEDGADRTRLDVMIEYAAPGGIVGDLAAKIFANPDQQVEEDLERFRACVAGGMAAGTGRFTATAAPVESTVRADGPAVHTGTGETGTSLKTHANDGVSQADRIAGSVDGPPSAVDPMREANDRVLGSAS
jgi:carbon monoxide dehydrogenase subunit G